MRAGDCGGHGSVWAKNLDDCGVKALKPIGVDYDMGSEEELDAIAAKAIEGMAPEQKYLRGGYSGGTYMDEAMEAMYDEIGDVWSNCPLNPDYQLADSYRSVENTVIDYGEGGVYPGTSPSGHRSQYSKARRAAGGIRPGGGGHLSGFHSDSSGTSGSRGLPGEDIKKAQQMARDRGGKLVFIASVLGTTADFQDIRPGAGAAGRRGNRIEQQRPGGETGRKNHSSEGGERPWQM